MDRPSWDPSPSHTDEGAAPRQGPRSPKELATAMAAGGRVQELHEGSNRVFRLFGEGAPTILKVYASPGRARRERRALESLPGLPGLPRVHGWGFEGEHQWVHMADAGRWTLASLPGAVDPARKAGAILRGLHDAQVEGFSNLATGLDAAWIATDIRTTYTRLERYRRRLPIDAATIAAAAASPAPDTSPPVASHTNPMPSKFRIDEHGEVTLLDWEWATMAPPEWDLSLAVWLTGVQVGADAAAALEEGYGRRLSQEQLARWTVYHAGMLLLREAETRDGRLDDLVWVTEELRAILG